MQHSISRLRSQLDGVDIALRLEGPIGAEVAQGVMGGALEVAMQISKHDAYDRSERDAMPVVCGRCQDTHVMGDDFSCTGCPVPCDKCRGGRSNSYCATTPCPCECHARKKK